MECADDAEQSLERNCPVCGSHAHEPWLEKNCLCLVRCSECAMIFANPVERAFADGRFYSERAASYYLSTDKLEGDYASVRFDRELLLFHRFCDRGDVLDVGCSTGGFLHQLATRFPGMYRGIGLDVAGKALDHAASRGVAVRRGSLPELDFGGERFDAISFWAVLEHLAQPALFISKAAALLKPGGYLFVLVPNAGSLAVRLLGRRYRYILPEHLNYFTAATLRRLTMAKHELEVAAMRSMHFNPVVLWQDFWRGTSDVPDVQRARLLRRTTAWKQKTGLWPIRQLYAGIERALGACMLADNLALVLRKPG